MSEAWCDVCEKKGPDAKPYYCNSCHISIMCCGDCRGDGRKMYIYRKGLSPRDDYCPRCNEKFRKGELT